MTFKLFFIRFGGLIILTLLGGMLWALIVNLLLMADLMPTDDVSSGFGQILTHQSMLVYMGSIIIGIIGIFIRDTWRWVLYLCPLYAASVFAVIHTVTQH